MLATYRIISTTDGGYQVEELSLGGGKPRLIDPIFRSRAEAQVWIDKQDQAQEDMATNHFGQWPRG